MTNHALTKKTTPKVTILMGVYNGADHLGAQLISITGQSHANWQLVCSDDGSTDNSRDILNDFAQRWPKQVTMIDGPKTGFSDNYMSLLRHLPLDAGYVCFADHDDVWLPEKIARGLNALELLGSQPSLYCARQFYWYPHIERQVMSPRMTRPFTLQNALIENIATGNTIMFNPAAAVLAQRATSRVGSVFAHDWWLYLLVTATGGTVYFDNAAPAILYRQHATNAIGAGKGLLPQIKRKVGVLRGLFSQRIEGNMHALLAVEDLLTPDAQDICHRFAQARRTSGVARLAAFHRIAPYRQRWVDTLGFWGAASLGRV